MAVLRAPWLLAACLALATGGPGWAAPTPDIPPRNAGQEQHSRTDLYGDLLPPGALARLGTVRWRSGASLWLVQFMPDGRSIISAAEDDDRVTVSLWDRATGKPLRRFGGRQRSTTHFTLSPDTRVLASAGNDHEIILWDVPTGKEVRRLPGHGTQYAAAFSPDGKTLAAAGSDGHVIRLWNVATGAEVRQFKRHRDEVMGVAFSPDGKTLASGSFDKSLRLWDTASGKQLRRVTAAVGSRFALAFSPDGRTL
ncbi:MAG TPA: WD40 repeat domain-containing protein, partial [Gemmataceae bacterium]|nr:WD40 repeat domain-containing protein [Gemmataceae bacterium]